MLVTDPNGNVHPASRLVDEPDGRAAVYEWDAATGSAVLIADGAVTDGRPGLWTIVDDTGAAWYVKRDSGCGCSHPMRRWRPDGPAREYVR